jgi:hypothetical protein
VAAPFIALRIRAENFDSLTFEERRQLLRALATLAPARAEKIALDVLEAKRLIAVGAHEESRALAAETLGRVASTQDALAVLDEHSRRRWGASEAVREAASRAHETARARIESAPRAARPSGAQERGSVPPQTGKRRPR